MEGGTRIKKHIFTKTENVKKNKYFINNLGKCTQIDARTLPDSIYKEYLHLLEKEIEIINPKIIVLFGNQVSSIVLNEKISVSQCRKKQFEKIINNKMIVIIQSNISVNDIKMLSIIFEELGIKIIKIIKDITLLNVRKNRAYLIGDNNLRLYFINKYNKKVTVYMNTSQISYNDIISIIQYHIKESLFILSSNDDLINKLLKNKSYYLINNYIKFIFDEIG